ncbi:MAG TPA: AMP-binding protein [Gemmatimonadaceae bacterium]|nr:AMP-binding protein [Gemmatimonadaceae bacterium]
MSDPLALVPLAASARGGRIDGHGARELAAAGITLLQRCAPLVRALAGKRAAVLLPTSPAFLTALAACEGRGAVLVNPLAAPPEVAHQLRDANVGAAFTIAALQDKLPAGFPRVLLDGAPAHARSIIDGAAREIDLGSHTGIALEGEMDAPGRDEEAAIVYTSAMAGTPLGAILTHRNLLANARATVEALGLSDRSVVLAALPWAHLFGFTVTLVAPLLAGGRVVTVPRFNPLRVLDTIAAERVTLLLAVPSVFAGLLAAIEHQGARWNAPSLEACFCGGAPLAAELQARWERVTGLPLRQGYGLTEAGPACIFNPRSRPNRPGTLGVPFPGVEVALRGGEICVRGENVFAGYVSGGAQGLRVEDGWLHTGDDGTADAEGYVTFTGVRKAMFTRHGFNIYPRELERVIGAMPGVEHVAVRAIPEPSRENDIAVEVAGAVAEEDVKRWCEARLSAYKQPSRITVRA